jgi:outer membrane protein assembly factor BamB
MFDQPARSAKDAGRVRRVRGRLVGVLVAALSMPAAAHAQVPAIPPVPGVPPGGGSGGEPQHQTPPPPPPTGPGAAAGEVVSYRGNPSHTGSASAEAVAGPLERLWTRTFKGPVNQPLIVDGKVIVNVANSDGTGYGSHVLALDRLTGRTVWNHSTPGTYFSAPIAANSGRVMSVSTDGVVRAFDVASGALAWTVTLPDHTFVDVPPVAAAGTLFIHGTPGSGSTLYALSVADGATRWKVSTSLSPFIWPVLDSERVLLADYCGDARAFAQSNGATVWSRNRGNCNGSGPTLVADGRLFTQPGGQGYTYDAATGADKPRLPGAAPGAVAGGVGYRANFKAVSLDDGHPLWRFKAGRGVRGSSLEPFVVGPTVYVVADEKLVGLDRMTGELLSVVKLPYGLHSSVGGIEPGISAGAGVLVATGGLKLSGYRSVLRPRPDGIDIAASGFDVVSGQRPTVVGGLGSQLRAAARRARLSADVHPFRRYSKGVSLRVLADGTAWGRVRVRRNTRLRVSARGRHSRKITIYAYPRTHSHVRRTSPTRGLLTVTMRADRRFRVGGRALVFYFGHARKHRYELLGRGRMTQVGRGRAHGAVRFRLLPHVGRHDTIAFCVRGLPRLGYGRNDGFQRRCGRRRISFAAARRG